MTIKRLFCLICTFITLTSAGATEVFYRVKFTIDYIDPSSSAAFASLVSPPSIGQKFYALVGIDDLILGSDGVNKPGKILDFVAQLGSTYFNLNQPSDFFGFQGPCLGPMVCTLVENSVYGFNSRFLGFDVQAGQISGMYGGVYDSSDATFIDFGGYGSNSLTGKKYQAIAKFQQIQGLSSPNFTTYRTVFFNGTQEIERIPEPQSIALFCVGLLGIFVMRRGQKSRKHGDSKTSSTLCDKTRLLLKKTS